MDEIQKERDHNFALAPGFNREVEQAVRPIYKPGAIPYIPSDKAPMSQFMSNKLKAEKSNFLGAQTPTENETPMDSQVGFTDPASKV